MTIPLIILAIGSALSGFIPFGKFVSADGAPVETGFHAAFSALPVALGLSGIFIAMWLYKKKNDRPDKIATSLSSIYKTAYHKFYIDEIYLFITKKIVFNLVARPAAWFDRHVVDGLVNLTGNTTQLVSNKIKGVQSGKVQQYAIYFLIGAVGLAAIFIFLKR